MTTLLALLGALCVGAAVATVASATGLGTTRRHRADLVELVGRSSDVAARQRLVTPFFASAIVDALIGRWRRGRRAAAFEAALPDALDLMGSSLEAGAPLAAALELIAQEGTGPLAEELGYALTEHELGTPLADALARAAARVGSRDFAWCVRAVRTQQEFGASLADVLRTLAEFMRWRQELKGEVAALTAEGRLSAIILSALPFVVLGFFVLTAPSYVAVLVTTRTGLLLTAMAAVLLTGGIAWMSRIVKIEV